MCPRRRREVGAEPNSPTARRWQSKPGGGDSWWPDSLDPREPAGVGDGVAARRALHPYRCRRRQRLGQRVGSARRQRRAALERAARRRPIARLRYVAVDVDGDGRARHRRVRARRRGLQVWRATDDDELRADAVSGGERANGRADHGRAGVTYGGTRVRVARARVRRRQRRARRCRAPAPVVGGAGIAGRARIGRRHGVVIGVVSTGVASLGCGCSVGASASREDRAIARRMRGHVGFDDARIGRRCVTRRRRPVVLSRCRSRSRGRSPQRRIRQVPPPDAPHDRSPPDRQVGCARSGARANLRGASVFSHHAPTPPRFSRRARRRCRRLRAPRSQSSIDHDDDGDSARCAASPSASSSSAAPASSARAS